MPDIYDVFPRLRVMEAESSDRFRRATAGFGIPDVDAEAVVGGLDRAGRRYHELEHSDIDDMATR